MQNPRENFQAIDNVRAWAREVSSGVHEIDFAIPRSGKRVEARKTSQQFVIAPRQIDIVSAQRKHNDFRTGIEHLLPGDLNRRSVFSTQRVISTRDLDQLRSPMTGTKWWIDP